MDNLRAERDVTPEPTASGPAGRSSTDGASTVPADGSGFRGFSNTLNRAFEFALTTALFLGIGWALDHWLGTRPVFTVVLALVGIIGQFARVWFAYVAEMKQHEAALPSASRAPTVLHSSRPPLPSVTAQVLAQLGRGRRRRAAADAAKTGKS